MTNRNIDLPSQRHKLMMDIELPRRQKFRSESKIPTWLIVVVFMLALTALYFLVARVVDDQAHASYNAHKQLCDQYLNDTKLAGSAAEETLKQICL